jgi:undecaprenyl-diphosphatase
VQAIALSALLGAESLIVNQGVKRAFKRERPTEAGDDRFEVRKPSTSSFPSGHASAAAFAATVLTTLDGKKSAPMWFGLAAVVGTSRAFVRIHHASDVIGGAVVGVGLGLLVRPFVKRLR